MEIKVGDLVSYLDRTVRVMKISDGIIRLSQFGVVNFDITQIKLIESVAIPEFKNGDQVLVLDIPDEERNQYGCYWDSEMDRYVGQIVNVDTNTKHNDVVKINGWYFHTYHLEPIRDYDMV